MTLENYKIEDKIYEGSHTLVYGVKNIIDNQRYVLKILKDDYPTPEEIFRFRQEYEITRELSMKGLRKVYKYEKINNKHTLLMEYFPGASLRKLIQQGKVNSIRTFLDIAIAITDVLYYIHQQGIIHKDIKPDNILVELEKSDIRIIDFGLAAKITLKNTNLTNPDKLEGTLAYISPEQTGRMNRTVDYRTDFYSLGVSFYEMLTGQLPFITIDSLELIHCHIAKPPITPHDLLMRESTLSLHSKEINSIWSVPKALSDIVMKLLAKNAEDRYQSAVGLKMDLEKCREQWKEKEKIDPFTLGEYDSSDKFQIPEKLYGRDREKDILIEAFERVSEGSLELMLITGYSGIGKSALVSEVHKPMTEKKGYFVRGKFDQFQRNIPYSAIIQLLKDFVNQILTESTEQIAQWKEKIMSAVGNIGQVIIEVVPSLELIIGKQTAIPELNPTEAQNRFNLVFQNFVRIISQKEHPIVMFIDDLQWADVASLNLFKLIVTDLENQYLFIIGTYRDNEVDISHPLTLLINDIQKTPTTVNTIRLKPLSREHIGELIADTLKYTPQEAQPLADLVYNKTRGNPFFINQFLKTLYEEKYIRYNANKIITTSQGSLRGGWAWDLAEIASLTITDNVVELMVSKIQKLPVHTQEVLKLAACIGNQFTLKTLSFIYEKNQKTTLAAIWDTVEEGLLSFIDGDYRMVDDNTDDFSVKLKFLHDRVLQAAYSLIEENAKKAMHLKIGQLALSHNTEDYIEEFLLDIVHHLNTGRELITDVRDKQELIELNFRAGKKAKQATAYQAALNFFKIAIGLLPAHSWNSDYLLTFNLYKESAECEYMLGKFEEAEILFDILLKEGNNIFDKADVYLVKINQYAQLGRFVEAIQVAEEGLKMFAEHIPVHNYIEFLMAEINQYETLLDNRKISDLAYLAKLNNREQEYVISILSSMIFPTYVANPLLCFWVMTKIVNISIQYGNSTNSSVGYAFFPFVRAIFSRDYQAGSELEKISLELNKRFNNIKLYSKVYYAIAASLHWNKPLRESIEYYKKSFQYGSETGDMFFAGVAISRMPNTQFFTGEKLIEVLQVLEQKQYFLKKTQSPFFIEGLLFEAFVHNLTGERTERTSLSSETLNEYELAEQWEKGGFGTGAALYRFYKMQNLFYYEQYQEAFEEANKLAPLMPFLTGIIEEVIFTLFYSLCITAVYKDLLEKDQQEYLQKLVENIAKMKLWADNCPENFEHLYHLMEAEKTRITNDQFHAMEHYRKAMTLAGKNEFLNFEALSYELAAKFYLAHGFPRITRTFMTEAHYAYNMWGAKGKAKDLEAKYPQYIQANRRAENFMEQTHATISTNNSAHSSTQSSALDMGSLMKASQAISGEIRLDKLLSKMMKLIIENAGAERGFIIQPQQGKLLIQAEGNVMLDDIEVLQSIPITESNKVAVSAVRYVERTHETLILADASKDKIYGNDPYVKANNVKSVLCMPIFNQGNLRGIIYLENNLADNVFIPQRVNILNMLSSQISISIENALLYNSLEQKVADRTAELNKRNIELDDKNKRITDSVRYAQTIQAAILPSENEMQKAFADYFVIYKPKDIVSGDFYWMSHIDNMFFIATVDCTGHGVPGAFMSMIAHSLLNQIVNEKRTLDPADILESLNEGVTKGLKQSETENNDGMDVCLCRIEYINEEAKVTFTGAKRHLYYISKPYEELKELKGNRISIGGKLMKEKQFTNQELILPKGSILYLTTDGFADQANNLRRNMGSPHLKQVIKQAAYLTMQEQRIKLMKALSEHQQEAEQRDDITLVGVKL